jgi:exodeoxyribonuclease-3
VIENVYIPAGGDEPDREINPKFGQKLDFLGRMIDWAAAVDAPTLIVGISTSPRWNRMCGATRRC